MGLKEDLQTQLAEVQTKLAAINRVPEDTFHIGTVALIATVDNRKIYLVKVGEESWKRLTVTVSNKSLIEWVFFFLSQEAGYFEIYILRVDEIPIYTSS